MPDEGSKKDQSLDMNGDLAISFKFSIKRCERSNDRYW